MNKTELIRSIYTLSETPGLDAAYTITTIVTILGIIAGLIIYLDSAKHQSPNRNAAFGSVLLIAITTTSIGTFYGSRDLEYQKQINVLTDLANGTRKIESVYDMGSKNISINYSSTIGELAGVTISAEKSKIIIPLQVAQSLNKQVFQSKLSSNLP